MPATSTRLPRPLPSVVSRPVGDGAVLLNMQDETYFGLNAAGLTIWERLASDGATADSVVDALSAQFPEIPRETLRADLIELLAQLREQHLVQADA